MTQTNDINKSNSENKLLLSIIIAITTCLITVVILRAAPFVIYGIIFTAALILYSFLQKGLKKSMGNTSYWFFIMIMWVVLLTYDLSN